MHTRRGSTGLLAGALALALGASHAAHAVAPPPRPPRPPPTVTPEAPRYATQYTTVRAWLDACVGAPRNGLNPQLDPPTPAALEAGLAELQREAETVSPAGVRDRRRCAAWALSRNVPPGRLHAFWVTTLQRTRDAQVRWEALYALHLVHDEADLPLVLRQFVEAPGLHNPLGSWLREWRSRRAVPCLAAIASGPSGSSAENAALSLRQSPDVPSLEPEPSRPPTIHGPNPASLAAPYARWWRERGRREFAQEEEQWQQLLRRTHGPVPLEAAWVGL